MTSESLTDTMTSEGDPEVLSFTSVECGLAFEFKDYVMLEHQPTYNTTKIPCYRLNYYLEDNTMEMVRIV